MRSVGRNEALILASVPLFLEYEAVLCRAEHLLAGGLRKEEVFGFLDYLAGLVEPVKLHYLWRPQLGDVSDEMVLETAINGRADCIVTFNGRHFGAAARLGVEILTPAQAIRIIS